MAIHTLKDLMTLTGYTRQNLYLMIHNGHLRVKKYGWMTVIEEREFKRFLSKFQAVGKGGFRVKRKRKKVTDSLNP